MAETKTKQEPAQGAETENYFVQLAGITCKGHTEKKGNLDYLSWGYAWQMLKEQFPDATYKIYKDEHGCFYHTDGRTAWVETGVTVNGIEHIEMLPIMNNSNKALPLTAVDSVVVNKTIQRSLTKAIARHGLGISLYTGDFSDLPDNTNDTMAGFEHTAPAPSEPAPAYQPVSDEDYWNVVDAHAAGRKSRQGQDLRTTWIKYTNATPDMIAKFDHDVDNVRLATQQK